MIANFGPDASFIVLLRCVKSTLKAKTMENLYVSISNELKILTLLTRSSLDKKQQFKVLQLIEHVDFIKLKNFIDHHRVWPTVYCNIRDFFPTDFPGFLIDYLKIKYQQNIKRCRKQFEIYSKIIRVFTISGIPIRFLKGIALSQKLYGTAEKRHSRDIDILIPSNCVDLAHNELNKLGFKAPLFDTLPSKYRQRYFSSNKDITYIDNTGTVLELHIRLCSYATPMSMKGAEYTLSHHHMDDNHEIAYLCWHGAHTLFHRLKWLQDIALYLDKIEAKPNKEAARLFHCAEAYDERRSLLVSWALCHQLYETPLPEYVENIYKHDKIAQWLTKLALFILDNPSLLFSRRSILLLWFCDSLFSTKYRFKYLKFVHQLKPNASFFCKYPTTLAYSPYYCFFLYISYLFQRWLWRKH